MPGATTPAPNFPRADDIASGLLEIPTGSLLITSQSFGQASSEVGMLPSRGTIRSRIKNYPNNPVHSKFINDAVSILEACLTVEPSGNANMRPCADTSREIVHYIIETTGIASNRKASFLADSLMGLGFSSYDDPDLRRKKRRAILELVRVFLGSFEGKEHFDPKAALEAIKVQANSIIASATPLPQGLEQPTNIVTGEFEETYEYFFVRIEDIKQVTVAEVDYTGTIFTHHKTLERILHEAVNLNIVLENPKSHFLRMRGKPGVFSDNAYMNTVEESIHILEYFCRKAQKSGRLRARVSLSLTDYPFETALYEADNSLLIFDKRPASCINRAFIATKPEDDKFGSYQQNKGIMDNIKESAICCWTFEGGNSGPNGGPGGGVPESGGANRDTRARDNMRGLNSYNPDFIDVDAEAVIRAVLALYAEEPSPNVKSQRFKKNKRRNHPGFVSVNLGDIEEMLFNKDEQTRKEAIEALTASYKEKSVSAKKELLRGLRTILNWTYGMGAFCHFMDTPGTVDNPIYAEERFSDLLTSAFRGLDRRGVVQVRRQK